VIIHGVLLLAATVGGAVFIIVVPSSLSGIHRELKRLNDREEKT